MGSVPEAVSCPCVVVVILVSSQAAACDKKFLRILSSLQKFLFGIVTNHSENVIKCGSFFRKLSSLELKFLDFISIRRLPIISRTY